MKTANPGMRATAAKPRYAMAVDTKRCVGCNACVLACKAENALPPGLFRDWITTETRGTFPDLSLQIRSERCNHCEHPACVANCPTGASHVGEGGTVLVARDKCTGCKACIASCPYEARAVHPDGHVDKCTFCLHRVQRGQTTACAAVCPTKAITFGDRNDPESEVARLLRTRRWQVREPESGLEPNLYFLV